MNRTQYKNQHRQEHYDRIELAVPKGMKKLIQTLASEKNMSINAYLQDLVRQDQEGMFDTMQIAEKNRKFIAGIEGNMHDGYDILFTDGYKTHRRTKKDVREAIIKHCKEMGV